MTVDPGFNKYEYQTSANQRFMYRFKPNAPREFVSDLDWEVEVIAGATPGKYTVVIDRPVRQSENDELGVYLQIIRKDERSATTIKVPGWCYADD